MKPLGCKSLVVKAVLLALVLNLLPDSAAAQWSGNRGGNSRSSQRPGGRSYPYPNDYPNGSSNNEGFDITPIIPGIVDGIERILTQPSYEPDYDYDYQPPPRYQPPRNTVQPAAPPRPAAPKNKVVTKKKPVSQVLKKPLTAMAFRETDARQVLEADKATDALDTQLDTEIRATGNAVLIAEWDRVKQGGVSREELQTFVDNNNAALGPAALSTFDLRDQFAQYGEDLQAGSLTLEGQQDRLADLQAAVTAEAGRKPGNGAYFANLTGNVSSMRDYNTMGQLAEATGGLDNPYPTLMQGAERMGMPVMFVSELTGQPVMSVDPVGDVPSGQAPAVLIYSPDTNTGTVSYLLDSNSYEMAPGTQQKLERAYRITFDPGVGGGEKAYTLSDGVYEWRHDATAGWNLYKVKVEVTIDNSRYSGDFQYLLNDESKVVKAGEVVEHSSDRPLEVAFDGGNGSESRKMLKSGRYVVGVDPDRGQLDLFDGAKVDAAAAEEPEYLSSKLIAGSNATQAERVESLLSQINSKGTGPQETSSTGRKAVSPLGSSKKPAKSVDELLQSIGGGETQGEKADEPATVVGG